MAFLRKKLKQPEQNIDGFTLVELLVSIAIIGVLVAMTMPAINAVRENARQVQCSNNLRQIGIGGIDYSEAQKWFPDVIQLGRHAFRVAPGKTPFPEDLTMKPETYGLQAVLQYWRHLDEPNTWVCPSHSDTAKTVYRNTYAVSIAKNPFERPRTVLPYGDGTLQPPDGPLTNYGGKKTRAIQNKKSILWVWDNYSIKPGLSGHMGPFSSGYTIPAKEQIYPHRHIGYNALWLDGHVEYKVTSEF